MPNFNIFPLNYFLFHFLVHILKYIFKAMNLIMGLGLDVVFPFLDTCS